MEWKKTKSIFKQYTSTYSRNFILVEGGDEVDSGLKQDLTEEKAGLKSLNKRLSDYIDKVRSLEEENLTLENKLRQQKNIYIIYNEEKVRVETGLKEEKNKCTELQNKQKELQKKYNDNEKELNNKKNELEEKLQDLQKLTVTYAEKETTIVSLVEELKFYDKIIQQKSKLQQQDDELLNLYEAKTNEFKIQKQTIEQEITIMKQTKTSLETNVKNYETEEKDHETKLENKRKELTKLLEKVQEKERLDEEIIHYKTLMTYGERRIHRRVV